VQVAAMMPRTFRTTAQYIEMYERLGRELQAYMNPKDPALKIARQSRVIPGTTIPVTSNPPISDGKPSGLMQFLTSDHLFKHLKDFKLTNVEGHPIKLDRSISISAKDLARLYSVNDVSETFANDLITDLDANMELAVAFKKESQSANSISALSSIMSPNSHITAAGLYSELELSLKDSLQQYVISQEDVLRSAQEESAESHSPEQKMRNSENMAAYELGLLDMFEKTMVALVAKYMGEVTNPTALREQIRQLITEQILPISPFTKRYLRSADYSMVGPRTREAITAAIKANFDTNFIAVVSSPQFKLSQNLAEEEEEGLIAGANTNFTLHINEQAKKIGDSAEILENLGLSPRKIESEMTQAMEADQTGEVAKKTISAILDRPLTLPQEKLSAILGDIPLDALYVYLSQQFMIWDNVHQFHDSVVKKAIYDATGGTGGGAGAMSDSRLKDNIPRQFQAFLDNKLNVTREGVKKGTLQSHLSASSLPGRFKEWHRDRDDILRKSKERGRKNAPFLWGHLFRKAHQSFSTETREVARDYVSTLLKENAGDRRVTDLNWDDPSNPKPRSWAELAHVTGAFADPLPGVKMEEGSGISLQDAISSSITRGKVPRYPGQLIPEKQITYKSEAAKSMSGIDRLSGGTISRRASRCSESNC